jgi:anaerobic magnesium-protoporphyrin IX monomethyl ester cyclase
LKVLFVVYDNGSKIHEFPTGVGYLTSVLREAGHEVKIYSQDVYHYPPEHLTKYLDKNDFQMVCLSFMAGYWQYQKFLEISTSINKSINRSKFSYVIGGHGPSPEPEYFLKKGNVDFCCIGEGERTIVELASVLGKIGLDYLPQVNGLAYIKDGKLIKTKPRELIQDLDKIPFPAWDLFEINHYCVSTFPGFKSTDRLMPVLSSRGCNWKCVFCYRMLEGIRYRSPENVIEEIKELKSRYDITGIIFHDECFAGSKERITEMCNALIKENLDIRFTCDGRLNFAKPELLNLLKRANCIFLNYGVEAFDDVVLKGMNKKLDTKTIVSGLEETLKVGIHPGINILFGNYFDTRETLMKGVNLTLKYTDHAYQRTIRPVCPYPGSKLYYDAIKSGKLKGVQDFYENKHKNSDLLTCNFTELTDKQFYRALYDANTILLNDQIDHDKKNYSETMKKMYFEGDTSFRGFRQT